MEFLAASFDEEDTTDFASLILELVERKLELFPHDPRRITGWDVRKKNGQPYVTVSAVVNMPDKDSD